MRQFYDDYDEAMRDLFDPAGDPALHAGYASFEYQADLKQQDEAAARLARRTADRGWRSLGAKEAAALAVRSPGPALQRLARRRDRAGPAEAPSNVCERQQRRFDSLLEAGEVAIRRLPFYAKAWLVHIPAEPVEDAEPPAPGQGHRIVAFRERQGWSALPLNGALGRMARLNRLAPFRFHPDTIEEYLAFHCEHVHSGDAGGFYPIEHDRAPPGRFPDLYVHARNESAQADWASDGPVTQIAQPLTLIGVDAREGPLPSARGATLLGTIFFDSRVWRAAFHVDDRGEVTMLRATSVDVYLPPLVGAWQPVPEAEGAP